MSTTMKPASAIHLHERDYFLKLDGQDWPPAELDLLRENAFGRSTTLHTEEVKHKPQWFAEPWVGTSEAGGPCCSYLWRLLVKNPQGKKNSVAKIYESMVRFPTGPLFGSQRQCDYQYRLTPLYLHTLRLLTLGIPGKKKIERIFLFFNGLNEIEHLGFYYDLASLLINKSPGTACIIFPFPGHLSRYPMLGKYAEKPLQRFINDPTDLFRQYLRFMVEIQWLLSALVPFSSYPVAPGMSLLAESPEPHGGRNDSTKLGSTIAESWLAIDSCSQQLLEECDNDDRLKELRKSASKVNRHQAFQSIEAIRSLIRWEPSNKKLGDLSPSNRLSPPRLHVLGYSLGGYLAQSVFFSWPFAVSSCTTVCSGGAIRDLRPVKVAHHEEWRAITHSLKYELESGMLEGRFKVETDKSGKRSVAGIPVEEFSSLFQIFNDVFLQDPHGSYRTRVSEFTHRLLFVLGGNDPIVSTRSVLEASPAEGINMIEVAKLSHFVAVEGGEWAKFWLPTVTRVISSLAEHSESLHLNSMLPNLWNDETTGPLGNRVPAKESDTPRRRPKSHHHNPDSMDSKQLRQTLKTLVDPLAERDKSFLMILRNRVPITLLGNRLLHQRGAVPHYGDGQIREFWQELQERRANMLKSRDQITLVVPCRLNGWIFKEPPILTHKPSALARELPYRNISQRIWEGFLHDWEGTGALFCFDPEPKVDLSEKRFEIEQHIRDESSTTKNHPVVNCLPDLWIGFSSDAFSGIAGSSASRIGFHDGFLDFCLRLLKQQSPRAELSEAVEKAQKWLENGDLKIVRVSPAGYNPSFLGERIWGLQAAIDSLVHSALALARSTACTTKGDFQKASNKQI